MHPHDEEGEGFEERTGADYVGQSRAEEGQQEQRWQQHLHDEQQRGGREGRPGSSP